MPKRSCALVADVTRTPEFSPEIVECRWSDGATGPAPTDDGTRVTESYTLTKPVSRLGWFIIGTLFGRKDRQTDLVSGMEHTLRRLRAVAEAETGATV